MDRERVKKLKAFQRIISYKFKNLAILNQALTHKSFANENPANGNDNNERLEFLGDSVLDLVISDYFYKIFPDYAEGDLSKIRASVVNEFQLAKLARKIDIGGYLLLGRGEELTGGRDKDSILANAYEALLAAIYLDGGIGKITKFINIQFNKDLINPNKGVVSQDYKTLLQEISQEKFKKIPEYSIINELGPDHEKSFEAKVIIDKKVYGYGVGKSKKEAHQKAAETALENISKESNGEN